MFIESYLIMNWNSTSYSRMNGPAPPQGAQQQQVGGFGGQVSMNQLEMCNLVCIILMNFMFSGVGTPEIILQSLFSPLYLVRGIHGVWSKIGLHNQKITPSNTPCEVSQFKEA